MTDLTKYIFENIVSCAGDASSMDQLTLLEGLALGGLYRSSDLLAVAQCLLLGRMATCKHPRGGPLLNSDQ
jgi:hypothetical protein